jgi:hypothetical protein
VHCCCSEGTSRSFIVLTSNGCTGLTLVALGGWICDFVASGWGAIRIAIGWTALGIIAYLLWAAQKKVWPFGPREVREVFLLPPGDAVWETNDVCFLVVLGLIAPRVVMFLLWLFTSYLARAFDTFIWPLLGFFFLPTTTLTYAVAQNSLHGLKGSGLALLILGIVIDLGIIGGGRGVRPWRSRRFAG